jgi:D-alanyl-D-alanine carboxypeptidase
VAKHLDGTPDAWKDITIRHLLNHTSGIKDFINEPTASLRLEVTEDEVFRATAPRPLNFPPGERYAYSNSNYHLLAMIIRKHTGRWYADFLRERIFLPLGMTNTRAVSLTELIPKRASGYVWTGRGFQRGDYVAESILSYGGGGIVATAPDLVLWGQALLAGKVLKPEALAQAWTPASLNGGGTSGYGLGWGVGNVAGHRELNHSGGHATGFSSFLGIYPEDRLAVVVLVNRRGANPARIARRVAGLYVAELAPQPEKAIEDTEPETTALLRECLAKTPEWQLKDAQFTPALWSILEAQRTDLQAQARALGPLLSLELLSRSGPKEARVSRYRAAFTNGTIVLSLTRDAEGRISGLETSDED